MWGWVEDTICTGGFFRGTIDRKWHVSPLALFFGHVCSFLLMRKYAVFVVVYEYFYLCV